MLKNDDVYDELDLSSKRLTNLAAESVLRSIPENDKRKIKKIWLGKNLLDSIPDSILSSWTHVTHLDLANNRIKHLSSCIDKLTSLKTLSVSDNLLETIPRSIGNLVSLNKLCLNWNKLASLPSSMLKLTNLNMLYLIDQGEDFKYREGSFYNIHTVQKTLFNFAVKEWQIHARRAVVTWILVAGYRGFCSKDVARMIGKMVYGTRKDEIWEEAAEAPFAR